MKTIYKEGVLVLENDSYIIEYSNPLMVPFEEKIEDVLGDWIYFYYTIEIIKKTIDGNKIVLYSRNTHDEPTLTFLYDDIRKLLEISPQNYNKEKKVYVEELSYEDGMINEDTYIIKKYKNDNSEFEDWYWMNISLYGSQESTGIGVTFSFIKEKEMEELYKEIEKFLTYTKNKSNIASNPLT